MSIYDNLANSDFVNPGQFKEQLKNIQTMQESTEFKPAEHVEGNTEQMNLRDFDLPGQNYDGGLASLRQQPDMNPMDQVENEQSILRKHQDDAERLARQEYLDTLKESHDEDSLRFQNMMKQASAQKEEFKKRTLNRETLGEDDFDLEYQEAAKGAAEQAATTPYDELVEQRNKMIFDNLENSEKRDYDRQEADHKVDPPLIAQNSQQFTLNKHESRPELNQKAKAPLVPDGEAEDAQV